MRVAVLRPAGGVGDIVTTMPAIRGLLKQGHDVAYAAPPEYKWVLDSAGLLDRVDFVAVSRAERRDRDAAPDPIRWPYLRRLGDVDRYVDLYCPAYVNEKAAVRAHELPKSRVRSFCEAAGVEPHAPQLFARPLWREWAAGWLTAKTRKWEGRVIVIQPFATSWRRSWPAERWTKLIDVLKRSGAIVVAAHSCYGPRPERHEPRLTELGARTFVAQDWRHVVGLLSHANLIITVDSACLHIGAALGKRVVGIFGPTSGQATCELYPTVTPIEGDRCEMPCYLLSQTFLGKCYRPEKVCARMSSIDQVLNCGKTQAQTPAQDHA